MITKLFLTLVAASCVLSNPIMHPRAKPFVSVQDRSLQMKVRFSPLAPGSMSFAQQETNRVMSMRQNRVKRQTGGVAVLNEIVTYVAEVGVGNPPTIYDLVVDTGSSNTWVGANLTKPYVRTPTSQPTNQQVEVTYGSGQFMGDEFLDQVTLGPGLVIKNQSIGAASASQGFDGVDGILGVGPADLTLGTLDNGAGAAIPTVVDNLFQQSSIPNAELGVFFSPTNTSDFLFTGTLTFGGVDESMLTSNISFVPITQTAPADSFWGIDQSITYGNQSLPVLNMTAGIVDTGTTLILLPTDALSTYQQITGGVLDPNTGLLSITADQANMLESLFFHIGNNTYELTPSAQIFPPSLNEQIGGQNDSIYLVFADSGSTTGSGLDFINGFSFLQRFYSVFDTTNSQVGFATTNFTTAVIAA